MDKPKFKGVLFLWSGSLISIILTFLLIRYRINPGPETVPLHYTIMVGVDLLGPGTTVYRIPLIGLVIVAVNFLLSRLVKSPGNVLYYLAAFVSFTVSFILLLSVLFLLRVT